MANLELMNANSADHPGTLDNYIHTPIVSMSKDPRAALEGMIKSYFSQGYKLAAPLPAEAIVESAGTLKVNAKAVTEWASQYRHLGVPADATRRPYWWMMQNYGSEIVDEITVQNARWSEDGFSVLFDTPGGTAGDIIETYMTDNYVAPQQAGC